MTTLTVGQTAGILARKGFKATTTAQVAQAVLVFQDTWRFGDLLAVDGKVGPKTSAALLDSDDRARGNAADLAPHFSYEEFACPCRCVHPTCRGVLLTGALVDGLTALRDTHYSDGLHLISAYRCPGKNATLKEASTTSLHMYGAAADIRPTVKTSQVRKLGVFSGIGTNRSSGRVSHVDVRGMGRANGVRPPNPTGSTVVHPGLWTYAR